MFRFYLHPFIFVRATCCCPTINIYSMCMNEFNANVYRLFKWRSLPPFRSWYTRNCRNNCGFTGSQLFLQNGNHLRISSRWNQLKRPVIEILVLQNCWFHKRLIYIFFSKKDVCGGSINIGCNIYFFLVVAYSFFLVLLTNLLEWIDRDFLERIACFVQHDPEISTYDLWLSHYTVHVVYLLLFHRVILLLPPLIK